MHQRHRRRAAHESGMDGVVIWAEAGPGGVPRPAVEPKVRHHQRQLAAVVCRGVGAAPAEMGVPAAGGRGAGAGGAKGDAHRILAHVSAPAALLAKAEPAEGAERARQLGHGGQRIGQVERPSVGREVGA
eukprot:scaffold4394_cov113-Isochrysis_galbana.AAC.17